MILSTLTQADRYAALHPQFSRAFEYIRCTDLYALAPGHHPIAGNDLFAIVEHAQGRSREEAKLECHRKYIDIHLVLEGSEEMGWKPLHDCHAPIGEYSAERDILFFHDAPASWVSTPPSAFCIFFPDDPHAPLVGSGHIRKVVFKIAVKPSEI